MSETQFTRALMDYVRSHKNSVAVKYHAGTTSGKGVLDVVGAFKGVPFWVESKTSTGTVSRAQKLWIKKLRRAGFVSGVVTTIDEFNALFTNV